MDTSAGGRVMSDTTAVFILDAYLAFLSTGDRPFLEAVWPAAKQCSADEFWGARSDAVQERKLRVGCG